MFRGKGESLCRKVRGMLSAYIDSSLSGDDKSFVEHHLEMCETCSKELASLRMTVQLLHRVTEVAVPRSFTVTAPQRKREFTFGPSNLRWLRPATAIVAVALVVLLMGDFLNAFENNTGVNEGTKNLTVSGVFTPTPNPEQQIMVAVPGIMGQMSLATAKAVGYQDYTLVNPAASFTLSPSGSGFTSAVALDVTGNEEVAGAAGGAGPQGAPAPATDQGEEGVSWPLRQIEIGLGAVAFVLFALLIFARRQRAKGG